MSKPQGAPLLPTSLFPHHWDHKCSPQYLNFFFLKKSFDSFIQVYNTLLLHSTFCCLLSSPTLNSRPLFQWCFSLSHLLVLYFILNLWGVMRVVHMDTSVKPLHTAWTPSYRNSSVPPWLTIMTISPPVGLKIYDLWSDQKLVTPISVVPVFHH